MLAQLDLLKSRVETGACFSLSKISSQDHQDTEGSFQLRDPKNLKTDPDKCYIFEN